MAGRPGIIILREGTDTSQVRGCITEEKGWGGFKVDRSNRVYRLNRLNRHATNSLIEFFFFKIGKIPFSSFRFLVLPFNQSIHSHLPIFALLILIYRENLN